jgi:general secretion pathway protein D
MTTGADPKTAAIAKKVTIQPLDAINALIVSAPDDEHAKVQALVDELDIEREVEGNINVIYLKHAKSEDLVSVLNEITKTTTGEGGAAGAPLVQADEATNSLILRATGVQLQSMRAVVEKLDIRRPQVFVETVIAEVSLDREAQLGVTWGAGGPNGGTTGVDDMGNPTSTPGVGNLVERDNPFNIIGTAEVGTTFGLATAGLEYALTGFTKYNLDLVVRALRSDTNSNILSTPTILTLDNEEAEIVVGQEVPFVTGSFNNSTNNNNGGNVAGSAFQTIERKDVGIKLKIKPQISDGDTIQLEVLQEISSVATQAVAGQADLITNRRSIEATVQVDDGQVVVLGGLIQDNITDTVNRVPFLSKIPVLGALFKAKQKTADKRNLMVFLKPRIIRTADELAKYSKVRYDEVRRDSAIMDRTSTKYLIEDSESPLLDEYDNVVNDGILGTERRRELSEGTENGIPKPTGLRALFSNRKRDREIEGDPVEETQPQFETEGVIDAVNDDPDIELDPIRWDRPVPSSQPTEESYPYGDGSDSNAVEEGSSTDEGAN